jgi:hypothetical protein
MEIVAFYQLSSHPEKQPDTNIQKRVIGGRRNEK